MCYPDTSLSLRRHADEPLAERLMHNGTQNWKHFSSFEVII